MIEIKIENRIVVHMIWKHVLIVFEYCLWIDRV